MVKRWKDELVLGLTLIVCALFGGYFGGKLAQMNSPIPPATYHSAETFGLPPGEAAPRVIVIILHDSRSIHTESASYRNEQPLNNIQKAVNII
ncbi:MAG: hypothetical protein U0931_12405 [Vulcanimicrobiota bacterium]